MKRVLLLIVLSFFGYNLTFAQEYRIEIKNLSLEVNGDEGVCESWVKMTAEFYGGAPSQQFLYYSFGGGKGMKYMDDTVEEISGDLKSIYVQTYTNERKDGVFSNPCGGTEIYPDGRIEYLNDICTISHYEHYGRNGGDFEASNRINFDYEIYPIIELNKLPDNNIGYDKEFNLSVTPESDMYSSSVYNWEYSIGYNNWKNMPSWTNGRKNFDIIPKDFLEADGFLPKDVINERIYFRINTCGDNTTNVIWYTIRKSAPSIVRTRSFQATCYGESDAYTRVFFDRQIDLGEYISYVLYDTEIDAFTDPDTGITYYVPVSNNNNITEFEESGGEYYLDVLGIPPSENYKFEIIGYDGYPYDDTNFDEENGDIKDSGYEGAILYTGDGTYSTDIVIPQTPPVEFTATKLQDITCFETEDGQIELSTTGGLTGEYQYIMYDESGGVVDNWTNFSNGSNHIITVKEEGSYRIFVRDSNGCDALKRDGNGNITEDVDFKEISINEPLLLEAFLIDLETTEPTAHGFTDGVISIEVSGGNHNDTGYTVVWEKDGSIINNPNTDLGSNGETGDSFEYGERLLDVGAGTYTAKIEDSKGCTIEVKDIEIGQPEALSLIIDETQAISCNNASTDDDFDLMDGELTARARGGVRLEAGDNGGRFYYYTWYEKNTQGQWIEMEQEKDSVLSDLPQGEYAVNIKDKNEIVIGRYEDNKLVEETPVEKELNEPTPIKITIDSLNVLCNGGNNAWIEASVTGGTLNGEDTYRYEWNNGETTSRIENLYAGTYTLYVYDSNDCYATREVVIDEPDKPLMIEEFAYKQPKAAGLTDGYIQYKITGGTAKPDKTYNYQWTDAAGNNLNAQVTDSLASDGYYIKLNNIGKGTYSLTVTDANYSKTDSDLGCTASDAYKLDEPDPLELSVEKTKVISCNALNEYGNPWADGELTAHAKGGVWLQPGDNGGLRYYYTWKKKDANGTWQVLTDQTDSIAINLDAGEYAVNIKDANGVVLGNYGSDNELEKAIDTLYTLEEPPLLEISTTQQDVYCFSGSDAWAEVSITGGTAPYTIEWSNGGTLARATELSAGTYEVHVTDSRGCEAIAEVTIEEPEAPVEISYPQYNRPSSIGATDAWIEAVIVGGTPFDDGTYTYFWENEEGTLLNALTSAVVVDGTYVIRLTDIPAGNYYLTAQDKNYEIAMTKLGCTHANSKFTIHEPIEAVIEIQTPISCNTANEYQDPFSDGALVAHISGGVPFETGLPYIYHWKKQNENGNWEELTDQLDSIAINLNDGNYALNVEDANGSVMGTYQSDDLIEAIDSTFYFEEPELLEVSFTTTEISCDAGNNGSAEVFITGGVPPYDIKWSNGGTTPVITDLIGGTYFVFVTDSRGCEVSGNVEVAQPGGLEFDVVTQKDPTCFEGSDGEIDIDVTGGLPPYEYQWNTGETTNSLENLSEGTYTLKIVDAEGCIAYKEIILEDPEPVHIDLGEDRTLCNNQEFSLDITIDDPGATYQWESDNGFTSTSPQVTLSEAGIYTATVTTALGCIGQDQIEVQASSAAIDADFLITSQAFVGEEVVLVNVSSPLGEGTEWYVPDGVTIVSESSEALILKFKETGAYEVRLRTLEGDCYQDYTKQIVVKEPTDLYDIGEAEEPFIKKFMVYPNPTNGNFSVEIELSEVADLSLRMISLLTAEVSDKRSLINRDNYLEDYQVVLPPGTYIILLETPKGNEVRRVIIK
ncbi:T9SS type A sorting domain-containing protein [Galbibacter sp. EGI 63066]|uniref:T9SS type A sorting domain-containing protein n=1 Tax=Galbibacter sp. EGI 63066 TaxID=2993559 RepID=UPI0022491D20|nr:T9SS type A sorting domain-containing protein [Galbibacter sp. EGI 63066]MCX2682001.1 T9SS type A sorting domain-containing protein [Galbibacter sp. EGI 63066]